MTVLPFEDFSAKNEHEPVADGIPETLINALSRIETLLEGSIQVVGDRLRIMVRLINIANGFPIWSQDYNKTVEDVFSIQDDIAQSVVRALKIKLLGEKDKQLVRSYTANREADSFYLQGRYFWETRTTENLEKAIDLFNKAIEIDPSYALAYSGLADC